MSKAYFRTPKRYDGTSVTSHQLSSIVLKVVSRIEGVYQQRSDLILATWSGIIGDKLAPMTQAVSFIDGVLTVKVKNSTLHSLLERNEKVRLLHLLRKKFPHVEIKNISFRIG